MIKIEISTGGGKLTLERENIEPVEALDDLMNLLFVSGFEINSVEEAIIDCAEKIKNNHKNDTKTVQNTCSL
jgi:hypothetical protein